MKKYPTWSPLAEVPVLILCGGAGERLMPLTEHRAKPAVPFAYCRIIDFQLSNCANSGFQSIWYAIMFKSARLVLHVSQNWPSIPFSNFHVNPLAPQQMIRGVPEYRGTADAVFQNLEILRESHRGIKDLAILSGDHILAMDFAQMYEYHESCTSDFTVCAMSLPVEEAASQFGVLEVDEIGRIIGFEEKPQHPKEIPGKPGYCLASMGNYFAKFKFLQDCLFQNAYDEDTGHDFGNDIIPFMVKNDLAIYAYDFRENAVPGQRVCYWRDVGSRQSFYDAHMDIIGMDPELNMYNRDWRIRVPADYAPIGKINTIRSGSEHLLIASGSFVEESLLQHSYVGRNVFAGNIEVYGSIIFDDVKIGHGCNIRNAIIDKHAILPPHTRIGYDVEEDLMHGFSFDARDPSCNIVIVPRGWRET